MAKTAKRSADYTLPLYMNGLSGRMLKLPAPKGRRREILLIAGLHTSIERIFGLAEYLNRYGSVTSPDLPGFGGMETLYSIGEKPDLDTMADYLAAFIKFRYRRRRFTVIAVSYGFSVVTQMLQRYPELAGRVDLLVSISGTVNKHEFRWKRSSILSLHFIAWLTSHRLPAALVKLFILRGPVIRGLYSLAENRHPKLKDANPKERQARLDFEIKLWKLNDYRTYAAASLTIFRLDQTKTPIKLPVVHVAVDDDHYFDSTLVEQDMRLIYGDFEIIKTKLAAHAPTILATPKDVEPFVPRRVRELLRKKV